MMVFKPTTRIKHGDRVNNVKLSGCFIVRVLIQISATQLFLAQHSRVP